MSERTYDLTFMDGTGLTVQGVTRRDGDDLACGVLSLYRMPERGAAEQHLGSWPILHIRKWVKTP